MSALALAFLLASEAGVSDAPAPAPAPEERPVVLPPARTAVALPVLERTTTWDLNVEGVLGARLEPRSLWGLARVRGGVLFIRDSWYYFLGATYEWSNLMPATFGLQAEVLNLEKGFWAQLGALIDVGPRPGAMLSLGWSVVGVELQVRSFDGQLAVAVGGKLRIPVGVIARLFSAR